MISFLGTISRRGFVFLAGFIMGFVFYESDSEIRHQLHSLIHSSGVTTEIGAIISLLVSEWFSQQHNKRLSNGTS